MHGVFATVEAANAEARRARDCEWKSKTKRGNEEAKGRGGREEKRQAEEEEEGEGTDEEAKKVNDEEPFVYFRHLHEDEDDDNVIGAPARRGGEVRFAIGASYE